MGLKARVFILFLFICGVIHITARIYEYYLKTNFVADKKIQKTQKLVSKLWLLKNNSEVSWLSDPFTYHVAEKDTGTYENYVSQENVTKMCPHVVPDLGPIDTNRAMKLLSIYDYERKIHYGGYYAPDCVAKQKVAFVVAIHKSNKKDWRNNGFILFIHYFLMKQQLEYQIFIVIKKNTDGHYESGRLFNIGFIEAQTYRSEGWDCFIFHDVNLLPLDTRNLYRCGSRPKNLRTDCQNLHKFGGAMAISPHHFTLVNGFSNHMPKDVGYTDIYERIMAVNLSVENSFNDDYMTYDFVHNHSATFNGCKSASSILTSHLDARKIQSASLTSWNRSLESVNMKDGLSSLFYNSRQLIRKKLYSYIDIRIGKDEYLKQNTNTN